MTRRRTPSELSAPRTERDVRSPAGRQPTSAPSTGPCSSWWTHAPRPAPCWHGRECLPGPFRQKAENPAPVEAVVLPVRTIGGTAGGRVSHARNGSARGALALRVGGRPLCGPACAVRARVSGRFTGGPGSAPPGAMRPIRRFGTARGSPFGDAVGAHISGSGLAAAGRPPGPVLSS